MHTLTKNAHTYEVSLTFYTADAHIRALIAHNSAYLSILLGGVGNAPVNGSAIPESVVVPDSP